MNNEESNKRVVGCRQCIAYAICRGKFKQAIKEQPEVNKYNAIRDVYLKDISNKCKKLYRCYTEDVVETFNL